MEGWKPSFPGCSLQARAFCPRGGLEALLPRVFLASEGMFPAYASGQRGWCRVDYVVVGMPRGLVAVGMAMRFRAAVAVMRVLVVRIVEVLMRVFHGGMVMHDFLAVLARPQSCAGHRQHDAGQSQDQAGGRQPQGGSQPTRKWIAHQPCGVRKREVS